MSSSDDDCRYISAAKQFAKLCAENSDNDSDKDTSVRSNRLLAAINTDFMSSVKNKRQLTKCENNFEDALPKGSQKRIALSKNVNKYEETNYSSVLDVTKNTQGKRKGVRKRNRKNSNKAEDLYDIPLQERITTNNFVEVKENNQSSSAIKNDDHSDDVVFVRSISPLTPNKENSDNMPRRSSRNKSTSDVIFISSTSPPPSETKNTGNRRKSSRIKNVPVPNTSFSTSGSVPNCSTGECLSGSRSGSKRRGVKRTARDRQADVNRTPVNSRRGSAKRTPGSGRGVRKNTVRGRRGGRTPTRGRRGGYIWLPSRGILNAAQLEALFPTMSPISSLTSIPQQATRKNATPKRRRTRKGRTQNPVETISLLNDDDELAQPPVTEVLEVNSMYKINVWWQFREFETFHIRQHQKLKTIFDFYAERESIPIEKLIFLVDEKIIKPEDTPFSLGLNSIQVIEGGCVQEAMAALSGVPNKTDESIVTLKVQLRDRKRPLSVELNKTETMSVLMGKCSEELNTDVKFLSFYFDGDKICPNHTPEMLDFDGGECIDVFVK